jgi:putative transposase
MARNKGQIYTSEQKAKVVLELLKEEQTLGELATQYKVTSKTIQNWKKEFLANASKAFELDNNIKANKEKMEQLKEENDALGLKH